MTKTYRSFRKDAGLAGSLRALVKRQVVLIPAVKALNFTIAKGEFVGLLGPNGAGKTTTLKMLTGLIAPSAGQATAFGRYDTSKRRPDYLRRIGMVMGQRNQLNPDLPALDSFKLAQAIYAIDAARFQRRLATCVELFGVEPLLKTPVRKLSLGERLQMELILAMLHEPELLFLDEPTIGLDFNAARQIRAFLAAANRDLGITVVLTSHYTKDIEELCRRVILINHGTIVYDGALSGMDERLKGQKTLTLTFKAAADTQAAAQHLRAKGIAHAAIATATEPHGLRCDVATPSLAMVLADLLTSVPAAAITDIKITETPLDDLFADIYRRPHAERAVAAEAP